MQKIKNRTSDITRDTVQKSVCVLSRIPLYGQIQVKMCLITHAYFDEGDFSKVSILKDTYCHLNAVMQQNDTLQQPYVGKNQFLNILEKFSENSFFRFVSKGLYLTVEA